MPQLPMFAYNPTDTAEVRLQKRTIFIVASLCCFFGCLWSLMYTLVFGWGLTAFLPAFYGVIVGSAMIVSQITKNHYYTIYAQMICIMYITTFIQWSIGGIFASGFVMAWAFCGPIIALLFLPIRKALIWFGLDILNVVITVAFDGFFTSHGYTVPYNIQLVFFIMNLSVSSLVIFLFASYFASTAGRQRQRADNLLDVVIPLGVELASEKDLDRLLEKMLVEAQNFCQAKMGLIYFKTKDNYLHYMIIRNVSKGLALGGTSGNPVTQQPLSLYLSDGAPNEQHACTRAALGGKTLNISTAQDIQGFDMSDIRAWSDEIPAALLAIPLMSVQNKVLGVLQLMDPQDPETHVSIPFDKHLQELLESFSTLAVTALESYIREQAIKRKFHDMSIAVDTAQVQHEISEITETDFFRELTSRVKTMRTTPTQNKKSAAGA